jgi:hypothetical protein
VALSQARILYQNHSGDYPQVILTIPVTCRTITIYKKIPSTVGIIPTGKSINSPIQQFFNSFYNLKVFALHHHQPARASQEDDSEHVFNFKDLHQY